MRPKMLALLLAHGVSKKHWLVIILANWEDVRGFWRLCVGLDHLYARLKLFEEVLKIVWLLLAAFFGGSIWVASVEMYPAAPPSLRLMVLVAVLLLLKHLLERIFSLYCEKREHLFEGRMRRHFFDRRLEVVDRVDLARLQEEHFQKVLTRTEMCEGEANWRFRHLCESAGTVIALFLSLTGCLAVCLEVGFVLPVLAFVAFASSPMVEYVALRLVPRPNEDDDDDDDADDDDNDVRGANFWRGLSNEAHFRFLTQPCSGSEVRFLGWRQRFATRALKQFQKEQERVDIRRLARVRREFVERMLGGVAAGILLALVAFDVLRHDMPPEFVTTFFFAVYGIARHLDSLNRFGSEVGMVAKIARRLREFWETKSVLDESNAQEWPFSGTPGLKVKGVTFTYPGAARPALVNLSCVIEPGEVVALVGVNGAGKTTLLRLLLKMYLPQEGEVSADGISYANITQRSLLERVMFGSHELAMPELTIAEMVSGCSPEGVDERQLEAALAYSGADSVVASLPAKLRSKLGRRVALSAGQQQRLKLAACFYRVLTKEVCVALLDEPMAHCDPETRERFYRGLKRLNGGKTVIVAMHDAINLPLFDRVLVMDAGTVVRDLRGADDIKAYLAEIINRLATDESAKEVHEERE